VPELRGFLLACAVLAAASLACGESAADEAAIAVYLQTKGTELAQPAGSSDDPVAFVVEPGESVAAIADRLQREGLISDAELFRRYAQFHELDSGIEAGHFTLRRTMTIPDVAEALQHAARPEQSVTVREGIRLEEIAQTVAAQTTIAEQDFLAVAGSGWRSLDLAAQFPFLAALPEGASLEGFLFPETYRLPQEASAIDLIARMLRTFDERVTSDMRQSAQERGMTVFDMVTLAAVVEREAVVPAERPLIAGVYLNRLDAGWVLAADPTIQYSLGTAANWWPDLLLEDLERDLPYNTYRIAGLPPGPICSPGLDSIAAVAFPTETSYYFFLADCTAGDGSHLFSETYEQHVEKYAQCGG
jgi:UPF0755 protein